LPKTFSCNDENRKQQVDAYLFGGMSKKQQQAFEAHYKTCDLCYEALLEKQKLLADMQKAARNAGWSKDQLEQLSQLYGKRGLFRDINWRLTLLIAVVLFVVVFTPLLWWMHHSTVQFAQFVHLQRESMLEPDLAEVPPILKRALEWHAQGRDRDTIALLEKGMQTLPDAEARRYAASLRGLSWLFLNRPAKAIPLLNQASAAKAAWLHERAVWYLANAYLLQGNQKMAHLYLQEVLLLHGAHATQAANLLEKISTLHQKRE